MNTIKADPQKNRLYITLTDSDLSETQIAELVQQLQTECEKLTPAFTCLSDLREFEAVSPSLEKMIEKTQVTLNAAGIGKVVRVFGKHSIREHMQFDVGSMIAGYYAATANTLEEAERLLDSADPNSTAFDPL